MEVVGSRRFGFSVISGSLDAFDDDEPTGGVVDLDPLAQRVATCECEVVLHDLGEVEQRCEPWPVREVVERDPKSLFDQAGEPVTHSLGGFDVLEDLEYDAVCRD